jgi:nucleotide-binding universal stress UspA family protein
MTRVLIAVDGSDLDAVCIAAAERLFGQSAQYLAVNVSDEPARRTAFVPVPYGYVYPYAEVYSEVQPYAGEGGEDHAIARAEDVARRAAERAGLDNAEPIGEIGDPGELIASLAERHAADVIVVGSHDRGWLSRLVSPSVSSDVMDVSTVPVLVVKSPS